MSRRSRWLGAAGTAPRAGRGRRLRVETLEPRLALTWVGVPPTTITPPSGALSVAFNSQGDASGLAAITSTEVDYYSFTATANGNYTLTAITPTSSVDTVIGLFSASGRRLSYNDDITGVSSDSRLSVNLTAGTQYYLGVTNYSTTSRGAYTWMINGPATSTAPTVRDDTYENNDTIGTAANLGTLSASRTISQLVMADAADWFRFTTTAAGSAANVVTLSFQNAQGNLDLAIYNSAGTLLRSAATAANSESISLNGFSAGTYYARVQGSSGASNPNYALLIAPPTTSTPTNPPSQPSTGGFQIALNMSGLSASQRSIFEQAANRWEQVITGDLPNATYRGQAVDDVLIQASASPIDGVGRVLGQAGPNAFRSGSRLPIHGSMQFDSADLSNLERNGQLMSVVLHEIGHILGVGTLWSGLISGSGTSNPLFIGAQATARYNQLFGTSARGVPVENTGGPGTAGAHWRESIFRNEMMTGWISGASQPLSAVTVASLADIGYQVNFAAADSFTPTSTMLASAQASGTTSGNRANLVSNPEESSQSFADISIRNASQQPRRTPLRQREYAHVNARAIDTALADARVLSIETPEPALHGCETETAGAFNQAWDELSVNLRPWQPSFSWT